MLEQHQGWGNAQAFDFDWGDYADFWEDNRAAVDVTTGGIGKTAAFSRRTPRSERRASSACASSTGPASEATEQPR